MEDSSRFDAFLLDLLQRCSGLTRSQLDEAIVRALNQIVEAAVTDLAAMVEFEPLGSHVRTAYAWARPGVDRPTADVAVERAVSQHLSRIAGGETIAIEHAPADLSAGRGLKSILIVPASVAGHVACAFTLVTFRVYHAWPAPLVTRFCITARVLANAAARAQAEPPRAAAPLRRLDEVEREHIRAVLEQCAWKINGPRHAAEVLGLHPNTLRFRMRRLGIERPRSARRRGLG